MEDFQAKMLATQQKKMSDNICHEFPMGCHLDQFSVEFHK